MEELDDIDNDLELDGRYVEHKVEIEATHKSHTMGRISDCDGDAGSETHIMRTKVTNISYSNRD